MTVRRRKSVEQCQESTQREKSYATFQPWKVAIVKKLGYNQKPKIICSGVLINEQWVLTGMFLSIYLLLYGFEDR